MLMQFLDFFAFLRQLLENFTDPNVLIIFDTETGVQHKLQKQPDYKQGRVYEQDIFVQLDLIKRILRMFNIYWLEDKSNEADDLIAGYSQAFVNNHENVQVYIVSNDNDFIQLVNPGITLIKYRKGKLHTYTHSRVQHEIGIKPKYYVDYLALKGDKSDNILGVPGIGPKRARYLIQKYHKIENIYRNFDALPTYFKNKLKGKQHYLQDIREFLTMVPQTLLNVTHLNIIGHYSNNSIFLPSRMGTWLKENAGEIFI